MRTTDIVLHRDRPGCSRPGCTVKTANYRDEGGPWFCAKHYAPTAYPLTIKISKRHRDELCGCEQGRLEDWDGTPEEEVHTIAICERATGDHVTIANASEAADFWYSVASGTFCQFYPRVAARIELQLRPLVKDSAEYAAWTAPFEWPSATP